jgi:lipopolysaccharide transport system ATP-binding protein
MLSDCAITVRNLGKSYALFSKPQDRLKQMIWRGKRKYYQEFLALKDINMDVFKGETIGIIGANGSGKSTLLSIICGNLTPTSGEVTVNGRISALLQLGAGFNPQFTGRENVYVNGIVLGSTREQIEERFDEIERFADIGEFIDHPVKTYSSGMFVRLAFAVAINVDPDILIIDEALSVGDMAFQRKCFARMESIRRNGATIVFVSHALETVLDICDRTVLLHGGERIFTGKSKEAVARYQKLSAAPENLRKSIIDEIRRNDKEILVVDQSEKKTNLTTNLNPVDNLEENFLAQHITQSLSDFRKEPYYDHSLKSQSTVIYPDNGAKITNPIILSQNGKKVNCLISGENYILIYDVLITESNSGVRFYNLIKTLTGVQLGGGTFPSFSHSGDSYKKGELLHVRFRFRCILGRGLYFINCGVGTEREIP